MEGVSFASLWDRGDVRLASQRCVLHVPAYESEDQIRFIVISFSFEQSVVPKEFQKNLKKSIDILLRIQLKDAPSPAFARSAAGELTTGKIKKSGKIEKKC